MINTSLEVHQDLNILKSSHDTTANDETVKYSPDRRNESLQHAISVEDQEAPQSLFTPFVTQNTASAGSLGARHHPSCIDSKKWESNAQTGTFARGSFDDMQGINHANIHRASNTMVSTGSLRGHIVKNVLKDGGQNAG